MKALFAAVVLAAVLMFTTPAGAEDEPNRLDCSAIRGTEYLSWGERDWYWANCIGRTLTASVSLSDFDRGFLEAGGAPALLPRIARVRYCESSDVPTIVGGGLYLGLMQFHPRTWTAAGGGDWRDPYQQGANTARLIAMANPASQWPVCWYR